MDLSRWMELVEASNTYWDAYREEASALKASSDATPTITPDQKAMRDQQKTDPHRRVIR
jgi:hypothetical protein